MQRANSKWNSDTVSTAKSNMNAQINGRKTLPDCIYFQCLIFESACLFILHQLISRRNPPALCTFYCKTFQQSTSNLSRRNVVNVWHKNTKAILWHTAVSRGKGSNPTQSFLLAFFLRARERAFRRNCMLTDAGRRSITLSCENNHKKQSSSCENIQPRFKLQCTGMCCMLSSSDVFWSITNKWVRVSDTCTRE